MPYGREVGLGPGDIVLDGAQLHRKRGHSLPNLRPMSIVANGRPSQLLLNSCTSGRPKIEDIFKIHKDLTCKILDTPAVYKARLASQCLGVT